MPKGLSKARRAWSEENLQSEMPFLKILSFSSCGKLSICLTLIFLFIIEGNIEEILKISLELCVEVWQRVKKEQVWGMDQSAWCTQRQEG